MILILYQIRKKLERKNYRGREEKGEKKEGKLADMKMLRMKIYITAQKLTTAKKKIACGGQNHSPRAFGPRRKVGSL